MVSPKVKWSPRIKTTDAVYEAFIEQQAFEVVEAYKGVKIIIRQV
jgi:hypothetical protein